MTKNQIKILDAMWSKKIREFGSCERCGISFHLNAHHIYGRRRLSTRWSLNNGICLCVGCHKMRVDSAHESPADFLKWVQDYRGEQWWNILQEEKNKDVRAKEMDYETIKDSLE